MSNRKLFQLGVSMIEMLVTLVILMVGLLGVAALMAQGQRAEMESYQRVQAIVLLRDMSARLNANRKAAPCYNFTNAASGTPYVGVGSTYVPACASGSLAEQTTANNDLNAWGAVLSGAAEVVAGSNTGAMIGARGCITFDAATQSYLISVAWQGLAPTSPPVASLTCGKDLYGNEARRRVVSLTVRLATLSS